MQPGIPVKDEASEALFPMVSSTVRMQKMPVKRCTLQVIWTRKVHCAMHMGGDLLGCSAASLSWHSCTPYVALDGQKPFDDWPNPGHGTPRRHTQQLGVSGRWWRLDYSPMYSQPLHKLYISPKEGAGVPPRPWPGSTAGTQLERLGRGCAGLVWCKVVILRSALHF